MCQLPGGESPPTVRPPPQGGREYDLRPHKIDPVQTSIFRLCIKKCVLIFFVSAETEVSATGPTVTSTGCGKYDNAQKARILYNMIAVAHPEGCATEGIGTSHAEGCATEDVSALSQSRDTRKEDSREERTDRAEDGIEDGRIDQEEEQPGAG